MNFNLIVYRLFRDVIIVFLLAFISFVLNGNKACLISQSVYKYSEGEIDLGEGVLKGIFNIRFV